jgi:hypothetical protein
MPDNSYKSVNCSPKSFLNLCFGINKLACLRYFKQFSPICQGKAKILSDLTPSLARNFY